MLWAFGVKDRKKSHKKRLAMVAWVAFGSNSLQVNSQAPNFEGFRGLWRLRVLLAPPHPRNKRSKAFPQKDIAPPKKELLTAIRTIRRRETFSTVLMRCWTVGRVVKKQNSIFRGVRKRRSCLNRYRHRTGPFLFAAVFISESYRTSWPDLPTSSNIFILNLAEKPSKYGCWIYLDLLVPPSSSKYGIMVVGKPRYMDQLDRSILEASTDPRPRNQGALDAGGPGGHTFQSSG